MDIPDTGDAPPTNGSIPLGLSYTIMLSLGFAMWAGIIWIVRLMI